MGSHDIMSMRHDDMRPIHTARLSRPTLRHPTWRMLSEPNQLCASAKPGRFTVFCFVTFGEYVRQGRKIEGSVGKCLERVPGLRAIRLIICGSVMTTKLASYLGVLVHQSVLTLLISWCVRHFEYLTTLTALPHGTSNFWKWAAN